MKEDGQRTALAPFMKQRQDQEAATTNLLRPPIRGTGCHDKMCPPQINGGRKQTQYLPTTKQLENSRRNEAQSHQLVEQVRFA